MSARAVDAQGNEGVSMNVGVTVKNQATADMMAPTVTITRPADGSKVAGTVAVGVSATDDVSVAKLQFYIDGKLVSAASGATLSYNWNTRKAKYGAHKLEALATDGTGKSTRKAITVYR